MHTDDRDDLIRKFRLALVADRAANRILTPGAAYRELLRTVIEPHHTFNDRSTALLNYALAMASMADTDLKRLENIIDY
jgi:hypothetical protein